MNVMKSEQEEKWEPVEGIVTPAARAAIDETHDGLVVIMVFSEIVNGLKSDLRINFGRVPAYSVYEEFVHPWSLETPPPKLTGEWARFAYPLLQVRDSEWMHSLSDRLINFPGCVHYRLLTLDQFVDVLSNKQPEVGWIKNPRGA